MDSNCRRRTPEKIALEGSLHSLYFLSLMNLDGEENVPGDLTTLNRNGDSTVQDIFEVKYQQYTIMMVLA